MIAILVNGNIKTFSDVPKSWTDENGLHLNIGDGAEYGFKKVVRPETKKSEQLGDIYFDEDSEVFTYPVETRTYTKTVAELKEYKIYELKLLYNSELAKTDWYIIREQEGIAVPQSIADKRSQLREECTSKENEINSLTTKASVIDYELPNFI